MAKFSMFVLYVFLAIVAAGLFGALHNQISYTVSPEYFTHFKFPMFRLLDAQIPERIRAAEVGIRASWWMGIPLGLLTGLPAFLHKDAVRMKSALLKSLPVIMGFTLAFALAGLVYGFFQTQSLFLPAYEGWYIPHGLTDTRRFLRAGYMHNAAYLGGVVAIPVAWAFHFSILWRSKK